MTAFVVRRTAVSLLTIVLASMVVFLGVHALPGDPVATLYGQSGRIGPEQLEQLRQSHGLDRSLPVQYAQYIWDCLHGDFGTSAANGLSVGTTILERVPVTLELAGLSIVFGIIVGCAAGAYAALRRAKAGDYAMNGVALAALSLPNFWFGLMLIVVFAEGLRWLPALGTEPFLEHPAANLESMVLPVVTLGTGTAAVLMRQMRSAMLESLEADHVRTARAKGLHPLRVVTWHAGRNSLTSVLTIVGLQLGSLISGTVVVEQLFALPGFGKLLLDSVYARDYAVVQGVALQAAVAYVVINLAVDLLYSVIDPRVRVPGRVG